MYIYISGPLTNGDKTNNIRRAIDAGERIASRGHIVFIPHFNDFWNLIHPGHDYEFWIKIDLAWVKKCDAIVRLAGYSPGADREVAIATQWKKLVFGSPLTDGVQEFMNSKYWCQTNNPEDYSEQPTTSGLYKKLEEQ